MDYKITQQVQEIDIERQEHANNLNNSSKMNNLISVKTLDKQIHPGVLDS